MQVQIAFKSLHGQAAEADKIGPSEGLIPSDLFTPDLEPTTGQLEMSLPIPYSSTSTNAPGHASGGSWPSHAGRSPVTAYGAQGQAQAQAYAQTGRGPSAVDVLSEK